jgi:hypothetical protein
MSHNFLNSEKMARSIMTRDFVYSDDIRKYTFLQPAHLILQSHYYGVASEHVNVASGL